VASFYVPDKVVQGTARRSAHLLGLDPLASFVEDILAMAAPVLATSRVFGELGYGDTSAEHGDNILLGDWSREVGKAYAYVSIEHHSKK
jgi:hypothetical protein